MAKHLRNLPHLDERETYFHPDYTYRRAEVVREFILANVDVKKSELEAAKNEIEMIEKL